MTLRVLEAAELLVRVSKVLSSAPNLNKGATMAREHTTHYVVTHVFPPLELRNHSSPICLACKQTRLDSAAAHEMSFRR